MRISVRACGAIVATVFAAALAGSAAWPQAPKTIKIVVPYPPAGTADIVARLLGEQIGRAHGVTMVIENRPGAGTMVATEAVSRAAPDGGTLLVNSPEFVIGPHLRKPNYDVLASFEPVCNLVSSPTAIVVNASSPYRTLGDLLAAARAKPGEVTMASTGIFQIAIEMLKRAADASLTYVPYPGNAPASNALLGNHVTSVFAVYPTVGELVRSGKLRVLAVASRQRIETLPDVPTVIESGFKDYEVEVWLGLMAPARTPRDILAQFTGWFTAALQTPEIKARLVAQESYPVGVCGAEFGAYIRKQYDDIGRIVREANIKAE
jgi:tripartite-type tricarboxylate transporter receptor subunit TctC